MTKNDTKILKKYLKKTILKQWKYHYKKILCGIRPLNIRLPQMNEYFKRFNNGGKNISFIAKDNN